GGFRRSGTLAQLSVAGGAAPRDIMEEVEWADWAPDGKPLAVLRAARGQLQLEYPMGKLLYQTSGWISHARVSPDGGLVAFIDHPVGGDDGGSAAAGGRRQSLPVLDDPGGRREAAGSDRRQPDPARCLARRAVARHARHEPHGD